VETGYRDRIGERERVAVLSGGELDGGRRATIWVPPHFYTMVQDFNIIWKSIAYLCFGIMHASLVNIKVRI